MTSQPERFVPCVELGRHVVDLRVGVVDVLGVRWRWNGRWAVDGQPLLVSESKMAPESALPLTVVRTWHGPLAPVTRRDEGGAA